MGGIMLDTNYHTVSDLIKAAHEKCLVCYLIKTKTRYGITKRILVDNGYIIQVFRYYPRDRHYSQCGVILDMPEGAERIQCYTDTK